MINVTQRDSLGIERCKVVCMRRSIQALTGESLHVRAIVCYTPNCVVSLPHTALYLNDAQLDQDEADAELCSQRQCRLLASCQHYFYFKRRPFQKKRIYHSISSIRGDITIGNIEICLQPTRAIEEICIRR